MELIQRYESDALVLYLDGVPELWIREVITGQRARVLCKGHLNTAAGRALEDELDTLVLLGMEIELDLSDVDYLASACASALLNVQLLIDRKQTGSLILIHVPRRILAEMRENGLSELLMIRETAADAHSGRLDEAASFDHGGRRVQDNL